MKLGREKREILPPFSEEKKRKGERDGRVRVGL